MSPVALSAIIWRSYIYCVDFYLSVNYMPTISQRRENTHVRYRNIIFKHLIIAYYIGTMGYYMQWGPTRTKPQGGQDRSPKGSEGDGYVLSVRNCLLGFRRIFEVGIFLQKKRGFPRFLLSEIPVKWTSGRDLLKSHFDWRCIIQQSLTMDMDPKTRGISKLWQWKRHFAKLMSTIFSQAAQIGCWQSSQRPV